MLRYETEVQPGVSNPKTVARNRAFLEKSEVTATDLECAALSALFMVESLLMSKAPTACTQT
jgi:hypothetical protein